MKSKMEADLDNLFGEGYGAYVKTHRETISFEEYISQLENNVRGGLFEFYYLAEMLQRKIGVKESNEDDFLIKPSIKTTPADTVFIKKFKKKGSVHYSSLADEGECLFGAIAASLKMNTKDLIEQFKKFMEKKEAAKEIFEETINFWINVASDSIQTRGGAARIGDVNKQVKVERILKKKPNSKEWMEEVTAEVIKENLGHGSDTTQKIKKEIKKLKAAGDHVGHIIAVMLGGPGCAENFVPMRGRLNLKEYKIAEFKIRNLLRENENWTAKIKVALKYKMGSNEGKRPYAIELQAQFFINKIKQKNFDMKEKFKN